MKIAEIFGSNVFSTAVMKERLPEQEFHEVMTVMRDGGRLSAATADVVAAAMKDWAIELGATHYTHWFQPLTRHHSGKARLLFEPLRGRKSYHEADR